ncbi:aldehyde dehydrogenase, dimeric NADP-preferring-like [Sitophilus oryzae]|uniref:Aldehyde dehydrogenase n=1 Tax=Sitophilus oryzae TaxID=7048 RepID=A0A6J2Y4W1_SITOR|nr:aldehyde dehydrogenase, dimeric NADP-preferring-like [Sitophilus oryzae]
MASPSEIVAVLRNSFKSGKTLSLEYRIKQLKNLHRMYTEKEKEILTAMYKDLRKSKMEAVVTELDILINDIKNTLYNIRQWHKNEYVHKDIANLLDTAYIQKDPYGVALVIGSWNYPLQLLLLPVQGAIAAGNCVLLKPSEVSQFTAKLLAEIIPQYLDPDCYRVYNGGPEETTEALKEKFDIIFYTGSSAVGKIIHSAANKNLTPTILELGGKSPCYIDNSVNLKRAVRRIIWGKFLNVGQTCVAPDYILCTTDVQNKFIELAKEVITEYFGKNPKESPDLGRIISDKHFQRLTALLKDGNVAVGGEYDANEKYIAPTILINAKINSAVLNEEIFGPILPIVNIDDTVDAIQYINSREKPLALYIFSDNKNDVELILKNTSSGSVCVNDTIMQLTVDTLPFGGVGNSGMGSYHGKFSFDAFSHKKSVLYKDLGFIGEKLSEARYPPYSPGKMAYLRFMLTKRPISLSIPSNLLYFLTGVLTTYLIQAYLKHMS